MSAAWKSWPLPDAGADLEDWQQGRCAMCGHDDASLVDDHCHMTGFVRGRLCGTCNTREGASFDPDWTAWREGDTPARAINHVEVYVGWYSTPIFPQSPLHYYTAAEQDQWWAECIAAGVLPTEVPWSPLAKARKDAEWALACEAVLAL